MPLSLSTIDISLGAIRDWAKPLNEQNIQAAAMALNELSAERERIISESDRVTAAQLIAQAEAERVRAETDAALEAAAPPEPTPPRRTRAVKKAAPTKRTNAPARMRRVK